MSRNTMLNSPFLLGFDDVERLLDRISKSGDGYPPYNIERMHDPELGDCLRITLAVAGFAEDDLDITIQDNQLVIRGKQEDDPDQVGEFLHRGIAARQFQRSFVLADGMDVTAASLKNGLLSIDLMRPEPSNMVRKISIMGDG